MTNKTAPSQQPCYSTDWNHFLTQISIKETNVLSKLHENWANNVTSTVFTCFHYIHIEKNAPPTSGHPNRENCHYIHIEKNAPPTSGHVFSLISTIFELVPEIIESMKTAPPTGGHVFHWMGTTFDLNQDIIKTNILTNFELGRDFIGTKFLTKFHEDGTRNVASRVFTS
ncbi:hypothetical protein DPMN_142456 [Dreissena polymorpha]|uniref:Uncharacterized protein n=1 Tax=Dreissena polymorpha TaxID=45954 RepID=A0A9D4JIN9_DREPO|nr:hypothetical protein DPMN_142456 [Dreissena polymorpha]